jgi:hypothetical protein
VCWLVAAVLSEASASSANAASAWPLGCAVLSSACAACCCCCSSSRDLQLYAEL